MPGQLGNTNQPIGALANYGPSFGGSEYLLEQQSANNSPSLDFAASISPLFDRYWVDLINIRPATNNTNILLRFSINGGATYDASAIYNWVGFRASTAGSASAGGQNLTSIGLDASGAQSNSATTGGLCGWFNLFNPLGGVMFPRLRGEISTNDGTAAPDVVTILSGTYKSATPVNALRIICLAGNITSGIVRIIGLSRGT